jgi:hypothetical protein
MWKKIVVWVGRIIATIMALYFGFILVLGVISPGQESITWESIGVIAFGLLTVISVVLSYFRKKMGAWVIGVVGVLFSIFALLTAGHNQFGAMMVSGGPLIIASLLMLLGMMDNASA